MKDSETRKAKASTCKLVLLAIADHANDYGEAYPGYTKLEIKTALSRQGLADTIEALKYNGLLSVADKPSRLHTNDYTINIRALPAVARELPDVIESSHLTTKSQATLLEPVKSLDSNHNITIKQPSINNNQELFAKAHKDYTNNIAMLTPYSSESLSDLCNIYSPEWVIDAIKIAVERNARNLKYITAVLKSWKENGKDWTPEKKKNTVAPITGKITAAPPAANFDPMGSY